MHLLPCIVPTKSMAKAGLDKIIQGLRIPELDFRCGSPFLLLSCSAAMVGETVAYAFTGLLILNIERIGMHQEVAQITGILQIIRKICAAVRSGGIGMIIPAGGEDQFFTSGDFRQFPDMCGIIQRMTVCFHTIKKSEILQHIDAAPEGMSLNQHTSFVMNETIKFFHGHIVQKRILKSELRLQSIDENMGTAMKLHSDFHSVENPTAGTVCTFFGICVFIDIPLCKSGGIPVLYIGTLIMIGENDPIQSGIKSSFYNIGGRNPAAGADS